MPDEDTHQATHDGAGIVQPDPTQAEAHSDAMQGSCLQRTSLVDMPAAWLLQLQADARNAELLALFRACKAMRDLVLSQHSIYLIYGLPIPPDEVAAAQAKLLLACKLSTNIHLWFEFLDGQHTQADAEASASSLMFGAMAAAGHHALDAITSVRLDEVTLNALVPSWLALTCPKMTSLEHWHTQFHTFPAPTASVPACSQLTKLNFSFRPSDPQPSVKQWQHQLRALPCLVSVVVDGYQCMNTNNIIKCCSAVGSQLTHLSWRVHSSLHAANLTRLQSRFPRLKELQLHSTVVDDQGMEALLSMQLQRFACEGFQLQHSYSHRPCTWQQLSFRRLNMSAIDRLPLANIQSVEGLYGHMTIDTGPGGLAASSNSGAAAVVARRGHMITAYELELANSSGQADSASLAAAMAIAPSCKVDSFRVACVRPVTAELLGAISQHLPSTKAAEITCSCQFAVDVWPLLLPSLPLKIHTISMYPWSGRNVVELTEAQVTIMCVHACRPAKLEIPRSTTSAWQEGWEQRLQAGMATAGHQHVKVVRPSWDGVPVVQGANHA